MNFSFDSPLLIYWQLFIYLLTSITVFCYWQLVPFIWWKMRYSQWQLLLTKKNSTAFIANAWVTFLVFLPLEYEEKEKESTRSLKA